MKLHTTVAAATAIAAAGALMLTTTPGCQDKYAAVLPQRDPALRKTREQFKADAAKRTYPADAPRAHTDDLRAQVGYALNVLEVANLSDTAWTNCEVWVNGRYVVFVPAFRPHLLERLWFRGIYDAKGNAFPSDNLKTRVDKVEVLRDGTLYDVKVQLAD